MTVSFDPYTPAYTGGAIVTVGRDASFAAISSSINVRSFLSPGAVFRLGGKDALADGTLAGTNGEGPLDYPGGVGHRSTAVPGWPILETDNELSSKAAVGREIRIAGSRYILRGVGSEIQTVTLAAEKPTSMPSWKLAFLFSGMSGETNCLPHDAGAEEVEEAIESLAAVNAGGVVVSRRGSGTHGNPYIHSIYFEGQMTAGDVNEMVVNTTGCALSSGAGFESQHLSAYVTTVQQGGHVERQRLTLATEAGYVKGDYFRLAYNVSSPGEGGSYGSTNCLEWGGSAKDIAEALSAIPALNEIPIPSSMLTLNTSGMDVFPSAEVPLTTGFFVDGYLARGDIVHVSGSHGGDDVEYTVESVPADGLSIFFEDSFRAASGTGGAGSAALSRVVRNSVEVARSGTGKSVTELQRIVLTATSEVTPLDGQGLFRLQWTHDGDKKLTNCLEYGAEAHTVRDALEALGYDLDGSGTSFDEGDAGHILVTRNGDASASSGYGYVYIVEFRGVAGVSTVVGNVEQLQVRVP